MNPFDLDPTIATILLAGGFLSVILGRALRDRFRAAKALMWSGWGSLGVVAAYAVAYAITRAAT